MVFYKTFSLDALWFAASGLALIFLGLLNIAAERVLEKWILNLSIAATFMGFAFVVTGFILLREVQAVIALIIFLDILVGSISIRRKM
jgi:hypothetical protein